MTFASRPGRLLQAVAWLALLAVVWFVALGAVHTHSDLAGSHARCELCLTLHAAALRSAVVALPHSISAGPLTAAAAPTLLNRLPFSDLLIRPPPVA